MRQCPPASASTRTTGGSASSWGDRLDVGVAGAERGAGSPDGGANVTDAEPRGAAPPTLREALWAVALWPALLLVAHASGGRARMRAFQAASDSYGAVPQQARKLAAPGRP